MADMTIREMLDDVNVAIEAAHVNGSVYAIAGYVNGRYDNWPTIVAKWGRAGKYLLSIDVLANPAAGAQCLDIEKGDATNADAPGWFRATQAAGKKAKDLRWYPKLYTSESNVQALVNTMTHAGIARNEYMIWSAHYGKGAHICGPHTCGCPVQCDATQYTSSFEGASLDASQAFGYFFAGPGGSVPTAPSAPAAPVSSTTEPTLKEGSKGAAVERLQTQLRDSGIVGVRGITVDGDFGPQTLTAVRNFQAHEHLTIDGIVGPATWSKLDAVSPYKAPEPAPKPDPAPAPKPAPEPAPVAGPPAPGPLPADAEVQGPWRFCHKCQGIFYGPGASVSHCPAGGPHDMTGSGTYSLIWSK